LTRHLPTLLFLILAVLAGCLPSPYYQNVEAVPGYAWSYDFKPTFRFDVSDTSADYRPYLIIRHSQAYPFNNIWVLMHVKAPGEKLARTERVNVVLAEPSGKWMGRGMEDMWEQHLYLKTEDSFSFRKKGTWEVSLEQNMRINPLPEVMNVGLRVEQAPRGGR
jgi:gliding motility-associated lipoprotein GldH